MANVKITELTELAAVDVADNDVLPIVDVGGDTTKKVTAASLRTSLAAANDYATYISLNANIDLVQDNVASVTVGTAADTETRLNANLDIVQDNVATNATDITSLETRRADNTTIFINAFTGTNTNLDTVSANADSYYTQLNANIDVIQDNVTAQNSYITSTYATLTLLDSVQDNVASAESNVNALRVEYLANVASTEANVNAVELRRDSNTFYTYNTDGDQANIQAFANVEPFSNNIYSLGAPDLVWKDVYVGPGTLHLGPLRLHSNDDGTGLLIRDVNDAQVTIDTGVANITANLNLLQDNVASAEANVVSAETRLNANVDVVQDNLAVYTSSSNAGIRVAVEQFGNLALQSNTIDFAILDSFAPEHAEGRVHYNAARNALEVMGPGISANVMVGQDEMVYVKNTSGATIDQLKPVYLVSEDGGTPTIALANAATEATSYAVGLTAESIADDAFGFVQRAGIAFGDTTGLTSGQRVHVGPTAGSLQNLAPTYPYFAVDLGIVLITDGTNGCIYLDVQNQTAESFRVTGSAYVDADLTVAGNLAVLGSESITSVNSLAVANSLMYLNSGDTIGDSATVFIGSGLDDATLLGHYTGPITEQFNVKINATGTPDTFDWSLDNFTSREAVGVEITGGQQSLANGISVTFEATTGHTIGDEWGGVAAPTQVDTGWVSNRNAGQSEPGYTHLGMFFDISDAKFKMFDEYDPEPNASIDITDGSFSYGDLVLSTLESTVATGTAPFTVASTTLVTNLNADLLDGVQGSVYDTRANASAGFIQLNSNINVVQDNVATLTTTVDNFGTYANSTFSTVSNAGSLATGIATKLDAADYTASDVLTKVKTVDGAGSGLDADLLDGQSSAYFAVEATRSSNAAALAAGIATKLDSSDYTASDVLTKIKTVDGSGSGLDADLLDGQSSAYYAVEATRSSNAAALAAGIAGITPIGTSDISDNAVTVDKLAATLDLGAL